jgi:DNA gyrase inhibitor GyrI
VEQLASLPPVADQVLGERQAGGKRLIGYRLVKAPHGTSIPGLKSFDLWVDAGTRQANHVDITIEEPGKPAYQIHLRDIRVGGRINPSIFDLTPPAGYTAITAAEAGKPAPNPGALVLRAEIRQDPALTAVVLPMTGSYAQAPVAVQKVESYLKAQKVTPAGQAFGRFPSERDWDAGYPVPPGTRAEAPFEIVSMPAAQVASTVVNGAWGADSNTRWSAFIKSVIEQGYAPAGPPMEIWSGDDANVRTQSTEMQIAVTKAN